MSNKKFCSIVAFLLLLLIISSSGCGSSSGSSTNNASTFTVTFDSNGGSEVASVEVASGDTVEKPNDPVKENYFFGNWYRDNGTFENLFMFGSDKVTSDITLYARWLDSNDLMAEYSVASIVIGYATGDNPKYVTQNLTLPTKVESSDISWSSSSNAISSNGTVTRQAADTNVTLTATATYNGKSANKTFELKVIKKRTRDNSKIQPLPLELASSGDISITRNASGDVQDIEGNYATFDINNADDAIDAVTVIKNELGISKPIQELQPTVITSDKYGAEYQFQQVHNGVPVFGRGLMVSANSKGKGDFMHSNLLPSDVIAKADGKNDIGKLAAENAAKATYTGDVEVDMERTEKFIYSLDDYENEPIYVYVVRISGMNSEEYIDESVLINARNGNILSKSSNILYNTVRGEGLNELGDNKSFDIEYKPESILQYYMNNPKLHIKMTYSGMNVPIANPLNIWADSPSVSAYTNMCEIMQWWKAKFGRDSFDGKGSNVIVVMHPLFGKDNAEWNGRSEQIIIYDKNECAYSMGSAIDVLTHETTHAVMHYIVGTAPWYLGGTGGLNSKVPRRTINEGYADIFGCIKDEDWVHGNIIDDNGKEHNWIRINGKEFSCFRNIASPDAKGTYLPYSVDEYKYGVKYVAHVAYLMHEDHLGKGIGLTWEELGNIWYKSMSMGFFSNVIGQYLELENPSFEDVRRCVVWAAQKMDFMTDEKLAVIKAAFKEVGIEGQEEKFGTIYGTVTDSADKTPIESAQVVAFEKSLENNDFILKMINRTNTDSNGKYSIELEAGNYSVFFDKDGYKRESYDIKIESSDRIEQNVELTRLNSISGIVMSSPDNKSLSLVNVQLFEGNNTTGKALRSTITGANGDYSFELNTDQTGDYTLVFSKDGYKDATLHVHVDGAVKDLVVYLSGNEGLFGTVYTLKDNELLSGVTVQLWKGKNNTQGSPSKTTTTDSSGKYSFSLKESGAGDYTLVFSKSGYKKATYNVSVGTGAAVWQNAYLEEEGEEVPIDEEHFPDANFRSYVKTHFDSDNDGILNAMEIRNAKIVDVSLQFNSYNMKIYSLSGIEHLSALRELYCSSRQITELDVSHNTKLMVLDCSKNNITSLIIGDNTVLNSLNCSDNKLTVLNISGCTALKNLKCFYNKLTTLDTSNNTELTELDSSNNELINLDVSNNMALVELFVCNNHLTNLDIGGHSSIEYLSCYYNNLTDLNVNGCSALKELYCYNNRLTNLNVSTCSKIEKLYCSSNQITTLDLSNCPIVGRSQANIGGPWGYNYNGDLYIDRNVNLVRPPEQNTKSLPATSNTTSYLNAPNSLTIVASIPPFTVKQTGEYAFDVSFDKSVPAGSSLILLNTSEDFEGKFYNENGDEITVTNETLDRVKISANFKAGETYAPVIAATEAEETSGSGGGCNAGMFSIFILFANVVLLKKR